MGFILANNRKIVIALALLLLGGFVYSTALVKGTSNNTKPGAKQISYPALKTQPLTTVEKAQKKAVPPAKSVSKTRATKVSSSPKSATKTQDNKITIPAPENYPKIIDDKPITTQPVGDPIIIGE